MKRLIPIVLAAVASPALAQAEDPHAGHTMPGMDMPATPQSAPPAQDPHTDHQMPMPEQQGAQGEPTGTDQSPGSADPPPVVHDSPAARYWGAEAMAAAAESEMHPPKPVYSKVTLDIAEFRAHRGRNGYAWEGEAWWGDLDRVMIKTRGEGTFGEDFDRGEAELLYSKALDPWWNLQGGLRQDFGPGPQRTWLAAGIEGRAPYQFDVQAGGYLSDKGQATFRLEGSYDQRLTQRLILQPKLEFDLSAQDMPAERLGSGLTSVEAGLRLRYEVRREFAPYIGVNWSWKTGRTAYYARADGHDPAERSVVAGVRFWF